METESDRRVEGRIPGGAQQSQDTQQTRQKDSAFRIRIQNGIRIILRFPDPDPYYNTDFSSWIGCLTTGLTSILTSVVDLVPRSGL